MTVRIYEIAKRVGKESAEVLSKARELGIAAAQAPSSSLDKITAEYLEEKLGGTKVVESPFDPVQPIVIVGETPTPPAIEMPVAPPTPASDVSVKDGPRSTPRPRQEETIGSVQPPTRPRSGEFPTNEINKTEQDVTLTWVRALGYVDTIRKALVVEERSSERALATAKEFTNEFVNAPKWVHEDSNVRYLLIQAFKTVEHHQKLVEATSPDVLLLSQTLVTLNRALRQHAGISDDER